jgi:glutamate N-acetyltransferase/amino-acid N-acetyltransferase
VNNDLPMGFQAGTAAAGFKYERRDDLGLIVSDTPAVLAGMFTRNTFKAAPVLVCQEILKKKQPVRAVLANAGQANACTGAEGLANCHKTLEMVSGQLEGLLPSQILPLSTGVVGAHLKMELWRKAVPDLVSSLGSRNAEEFTRAFMTTDAFPKFATRQLALSGGTVRLAVMAKGAGMICPNMATMLCVALTDVGVAHSAWQGIFARAVEATFNRVSVDGDTSTNDSILGLANGASGVLAENPEDLATLEKVLTEILATVSLMLVRDGEGASKVIHITVRGAATDADARSVARSVGHSQLVKTAIYGGDANWGRIVTAVGYSGASFDPEQVSMKLCGLECFRQGRPVNEDQEDALAQLLQAQDVQIEIDLGSGSATYSFHASDLGHEYVSLNADYRS